MHLCRIEGQVLHYVGHASLMFLFENRASLDDKVKGRPVDRLLAETCVVPAPLHQWDVASVVCLQLAALEDEQAVTLPPGSGACTRCVRVSA